MCTLMRALSIGLAISPRHAKEPLQLKKRQSLMTTLLKAAGGGCWLSELRSASIQLV